MEVEGGRDVALQARSLGRSALGFSIPCAMTIPHMVSMRGKDAAEGFVV